MNLRAVLVGATCVLAVAGCSGSKTDGQPNGGEPQAPTAAPPSATPPSAPVGGADDLEGITHVEFEGRGHVTRDQRVAYTHSPPFGGAHEGVWANCNGVVYSEAVRNENMIHSLEHGAVWIAYNPDALGQDAINTLAARVNGRPYTMMSPYPGLDQPISLQSWGYQLKLADAADPRIDQFITALRGNQETTPEPGATCDVDPSHFDRENPPPFDPSEPGPDAVPEDFAG